MKQLSAFLPALGAAGPAAAHAGAHAHPHDGAHWLALAAALAVIALAATLWSMRK
jgi:hypothetical protein